MKKNIAQSIFFFLGFFIAVSTLLYTSNLFEELSKEETQEINLYAEALKTLKSIGNTEDSELSLYYKIIQQNKTVPTLIFDDKDNLIQYKNVTISKRDEERSKEELLKKKKMHKTPIVIEIGEDQQQYIYYGYSSMLYNLRYMPIVQLVLMTLLLITGYVMYRSMQQSKQNKLWVGLSKETAHQLGTPISSLIAWIDLLNEEQEIPQYLPEIKKDIERLKIISDRFSNIGSAPIKKKQDLIPIIENTASYMNSRTSNSIQIIVNKTNDAIFLDLNKELFAWVLENLIKNGVDAIVQKGIISISVSVQKHSVFIDITDTGKGIATHVIDKVFNPGYSTKKRGWGLGLSLAQRIIKDYHNGRIFVKNSEIGKGTVFRIILPRT